MSEEVWNHINQFDPKIAELLYPRIYDIPGDYGSPKRLACDIGSAFLGVRRKSPYYNQKNFREDDSFMAGILTAHVAIKYQMPTYFIQREFLDAAINTSAPLDMPIEELKFPMPAMAIMLPRNFIFTPSDGPLEYLFFASRKKGEMLRTFGDEDLPTMESDMITYYGRASSAVFGGHVNVPVGGKIGDIILELEQSEPKAYGYLGDKTQEAAGASSLLTDADRKFNQRVFEIIIKLLLALTARPELIHTGLERKPAQIKKGQMQRAFWSPNIIGKEFKAQRTKDGEVTSTSHASPRMHWRRGHYRNQRHGESFRKIKLLWIEPTLIGAAV